MGLVSTSSPSVSRRFWPDRLRASGIHLGLSLAIAALAGALVLLVWYPYPYRDISGGRELFILVVSVDVVLGPLVTLAIFNRAKPWPVLRRDLAVIAALQLGALAYGMWTVYVARPVHLVFEYSRFAVVHAIDVPESLLPQKAPQVEAFPHWGPTPLSLRPFRDESEKIDATLAALRGLSLAARPDLWQPYAAAIAQIRQTARPVAQLKSRFPARAAEIDAALQPFGDTAQGLAYVPMMGRKSFWTVILDPATADIKAFVPLDPF